jgi:ribonuclease Z
VDLDVVFLGTAGSAPTARRAPSATLVRRGGERLLFDCGEGTQRQLLRSDVGLVDLQEIFLTHFHADHFLGLPGMLKTFALRGRELPVTIYGPRGLEELLGTLRRIFGRLPFDVRTVELAADASLPRDGYELRTFPARHGREALGYALVEEERPGRFDPVRARELGVQEGPQFGRLQRGEAVEAGGRLVAPGDVMGDPRPGRTLVFTGDTEPCEATVAVAQGACLLVHDSTFANEEAERARQTGHSTARQAAEVARKAGVSLLALTHLSSRYFAPVIEKEAREVFERAVVPRDFDLIEVPFPERGAPQLVKSGARTPREPSAAPVEV